MHGQLNCAINCRTRYTRECKKHFAICAAFVAALHTEEKRNDSIGEYTWVRENRQLEVATKRQKLNKVENMESVTRRNDAYLVGRWHRNLDIAQIPLGSSRLETTRHVRRYEFWLCRACRTARLDTTSSTRLDTSNVSSPWILAVSSVSNSTARHVERVESFRNVTWRAKWNMGLCRSARHGHEWCGTHAKYRLLQSFRIATVV